MKAVINNNQETNLSALTLPASYRSVRAFTLLEAIIALALMIALLSGVYGFYSNTLKARHEGGKVARDVMLMRAILGQMADELRHATSFTPGDGIGFQGTEEYIKIVYFDMPERNQAFRKYNSVREDLPPAQMDIRRSEYNLLWDDELRDEDGIFICHGLWRTEQRTFDPNPSFVMADAEIEDGEPEKKEKTAPLKKGELIAPEIKYMRFEYHDGAEWHDRWHVAIEEDIEEEDEEGDEGEGEKVKDEPIGDEQVPAVQACSDCDENGYVLPQAVRITVGLHKIDPDEEEFDVTVLEETEERRENREYYPDRFTIVVYLRQADQSLLSSRKYGASRSEQMTGRGDEW
ncbi:MAG: PulJ/GspJ family protein [Planctomycetota bacterium]|jgi:hypothetical protein